MRTKISLTTKLKPPQSGLIAIEPEDYAAAEVKALKASGAKVLAYLSVGTADNQRASYGYLKQFCFNEWLEDWPHERYLDLRYPDVRDWMQKQAIAIKKLGYDGFWIDNTDMYESYRSTEMFQAITSTLVAIKAVGGYIMINGGIAYMTDLVAPHKVQLGAFKDPNKAKKLKKALKEKGFAASVIDADGLHKVQAGAFTSPENANQMAAKLQASGFSSAKRISLTSIKPKAAADAVMQEEVFSLITSYAGKGKFGKQSNVDSERYQAYIRLMIKNGLDGGLLEYTDSNTLKLRINAFADAVGAKYVCISDDVDL